MAAACCLQFAGYVAVSTAAPSSNRVTLAPTPEDPDYYQCACDSGYYMNTPTPVIIMCNVSSQLIPTGCVPSPFNPVYYVVIVLGALGIFCCVVLAMKYTKLCKAKEIEEIRLMQTTSQAAGVSVSTPPQSPVVTVVPVVPGDQVPSDEHNKREPDKLSAASAVSRTGSSCSTMFSVSPSSMPPYESKSDASSFGYSAASRDAKPKSDKDSGFYGPNNDYGVLGRDDSGVLSKVVTRSSLPLGTSAPEPAQFRHGKNEYTVMRRLGQGHFGTAFLVMNEREQRPVVLKAQLCDTDSKKNSTFQEAMALAKYSAPNLLKFTDLFVQGSTVCIVMNYCSGGSLADEVHHENPIPEVIRLIKELCMGLCVLHERNTVHRDIKPDNVFLSDPTSRTAILGDFGLVRHLSEGEIFYDSNYGHKLYKAPEIQFRQVSSRSDMWAVGCVLLELLSHQSMTELYDRERVVLGALPENELNGLISRLLRPIEHDPVCHLVRLLLAMDPSKRLTAQQVVEWQETTGVVDG